MVDLNQHRTSDVLHAGDVVVVVHDFDARSADELTLRKGDRVELVELDDGFGDGWYLGRHSGRAATGLFPGVYTAKLPVNLTTIRPPSTSQTPNLLNDTKTTSPTNNLPEVPSGLRTSLASDSPKPYQHASISPTTEKSLPPSNSYNNAQSPQLENPRASNPQPHSAHGPIVQRSIGQALDDAHTGNDSPVMNETLSVIQEHITDLSTPRQSLAPPQTIPEDSESEYSTSQVERSSIAAGMDTDDDERDRLNVETVSKWDHRQTANHLRQLGVDSRHCDIFEDQEISGDVLLEMDQSFLNMKEYDFGVMGRRLKTWHKIRDFQNEVRGIPMAKQEKFSEDESTESTPQNQNRVLSGATILPRIPNLSEKPGLSFRHSLHGQPDNDAGFPRPLQTQHFGHTSRTSLNSSTPSTPWRASVIAESPSRPSAAVVREMSHSRRHSSIDFGKAPDLEMPLTSVLTGTSSHQKQKSFDRNWSMTAVTPSATNPATPSLRSSTIRKQESLEFPAGSPLLSDTSNLDLDRGYFSGNEVDNRKARNVLRKRDSMADSAHSRQSSYFDESRKASAALKRQSRLSSLDSSRGQNIKISSPINKNYNNDPNKARFRSASARGPVTQSSPGVKSPTADQEDDYPTALPSSRNISSPIGNSSSTLGRRSIQNQARKIMGLRAASDVVTGASPGTSRDLTQSTTNTSSTLRDSPIASPDGSSTPSVASRSLDIDNTDASSKNTDPVVSVINPHTSAGAKRRPKQQMNAYSKGLLPIPAQEARRDADHSGWIRKKTNLVTPWKPRFFVLRGKRLSYYHSENELEERGVIDITAHKVLVASSDFMTTLHATITGGSASNPATSSTSPVTARSPNNASSGMFYFKLVPPRSGMSRAVQFTKPAIHYFQVDTIGQGRKWMGEIMKATIIHDLSNFETTNKQKTISLRQARERKERPPALKGTETSDEPASQDQPEKENGLNITGVNFDSTDNNNNNNNPRTDGGQTIFSKVEN